jgi:hypothetical protein
MLITAYGIAGAFLFEYDLGLHYMSCQALSGRLILMYQRSWEIATFSAFMKFL